MTKYTGKVSKMGNKRIINVPRKLFEHFRKGKKVTVEGVQDER
jgi:hypothetical protein